MKVKMKKPVAVLLVVAVVLALGFLLGRMRVQHHAAMPMGGHPDHEEELYQCPMHPQIVQKHPGECPICHMDLQRVAGRSARETKSREADAPGVPGRAAVDVTLYRQQLIGVKTGEVTRQDLHKTIYTVGRIAFDPKLYQGQQEFVSSLRAYEAARKSPVPGAEERAEKFLEASRLKLRLAGMSETQIEELAGSGTTDESLLVASDEGRTWMYADIYEQELPFVKIGQEVEARLPTEPGKVYQGMIAAIDPVLDMKTRTVRARVQLQGKDLSLRPGMYMNAVIHTSIGEKRVVPRTAVLATGKRNIVFVAQGEGRFEPREVRLGVRGEGVVEILSGLEEGERIVVSGNFLLDAESQLMGSASGSAFYGGREAAEGAPGGHVH